MWWKEYKDYPPEEPLIKEQVSSGEGIIGCEMHDINSWGESLHRQKKHSSGFFGWLSALFDSNETGKSKDET